MAIDLLITKTDIIHEKLNEDYMSIFIKNPIDLGFGSFGFLINKFDHHKCNYLIFLK